MKNIIIIAILVALFIYITGPVITFKPFSVEFRSIYHAIGVVLVLVGLIFINLQGEKDGYLKGYHKGTSDAIEIINKKFDEFKEEKMK